VAGDEDVAIGLRGVRAVEDGIDVGEFGWLDEFVALYLQAATAVGGVALEFRFDPVGGGIDAGTWREVSLHAGESAAVVEADELGDDGFNVVRRDLLERGDDGGICRCGRDGLAQRKLLLCEKKAGSEKRKADHKTAEMSEEAGAGSHDHSPCGKTRICKHSHA